MSFLNFSELQYINVIDSNESMDCGSFQTQENGELGHIRVLIYINKTSQLSGNETLQLKLYSDSNFEHLIYTSKEAKISDIDYTTDYWIGTVTVDFNREAVSSCTRYYLKAEVSNYTKANDHFIAFGYDYPFRIYATEQARFFEHNIQFQIFTYQDRD